MTAITTLTEDQCSALLELLQASCSVFWGPDREHCREMLASDYFLPWDIIGPLIACDPPDALKRLKAIVQTHTDFESLFNSLEESYVALFVNTRGGIAAPLYQSCYVETNNPQTAGILMGPPAAMMQQRLAALELSQDHSSNEPPDHLAIEIEYLYFLLQKGWVEQHTARLSEAAMFVDTELLEWVPRFEERLRTAHPDSFYALAAAMLVGTLRLIAEL